MSQKSSHRLTGCNFVKSLSIFKNFYTAGKPMKFATKPIWHYPPHPRHVATLPWEIKNSNFLQIWKKTQINCILIASNLVIHIHILIFLVFKIENLSPHWLQIKFLMSLLFYLFTFVISLWHWKFVTADVTLYLKEYTAKRMTDEFPEKSWTNKMLISCWKSCRTQAQLMGTQAAADRAVPAPKKTAMLSYA